MKAFYRKQRLFSALVVGASRPQTYSMNTGISSMDPVGRIQCRTVARRPSGGTYGVMESPVGRIGLAFSDEGLCVLWPLRREFPAEAMGMALCRRWRQTQWEYRPEHVSDWEAFLQEGQDEAPAPVALYGTPWQQQVWVTLCLIPLGTTWTYAEVAEKAGRPGAFRAAANAVAANPVAWLVPCHRVVRTDGTLGGYAWGLDLKQALLRREGCAVL